MIQQQKLAVHPSDVVWLAFVDDASSSKKVVSSPLLLLAHTVNQRIYEWMITQYRAEIIAIAKPQ